MACFIWIAGSCDCTATPAAGAAPPPIGGLDVRDYGVKCDGATDDTAAFRAVAAAIVGHAALVRIPTGTCLLGGPVTWSGDAIAIRGSGRGTVVLQQDPTADTFVFAPADPAIASGYQNGIADLRLARSADTAAGSGLRLVRQINFKGDDLDLREFFTALLIEGGSDIQFQNTTIAAGRFWSRDAVKSGSSFVRLAPAMFGPVHESPGEIFFSNFNWRGELNSQQVDTGLVVNGVDGLWLQNGHVGFDATDLVITPSADGVNIQSVLVSNVYFDGSNFGGTGLLMPASQTARNTIEEIVFANAVFANHLRQGALIQERSVVGLKFVGGTFRNERGWCLDAAAVGRIEVNATTFTRCGSQSGAGALSIGATVPARRALVSDNLFDGCAASTVFRADSLTAAGNSFERSCAK